jgi:acyl-homoserine-lactone acylase
LNRTGGCILWGYPPALANGMKSKRRLFAGTSTASPPESTTTQTSSLKRSAKPPRDAAGQSAPSLVGSVSLLKADADSRGGLLFAFWAREMKIYRINSPAFATPWDKKKPLKTPDGLADPKEAARALEHAAAKVKSAYGGSMSPGAMRCGCAWARKILRATEARANWASSGWSVTRRRKAAIGDCLAATLTSRPSSSRTRFAQRRFFLNGNATQPGSPHIGDQLELFAKRQMRPVWRTRAEIKAHLESREVMR